MLVMLIKDEERVALMGIVCARAGSGMINSTPKIRTKSTDRNLPKPHILLRGHNTNVLKSNALTLCLD